MRQTIFFGCPSWEGYRQGGIIVGDTNVVQPGFGMNAYPTFTKNGTADPPAKEQAVLDPPGNSSRTQDGNFLKAKTWTGAGRSGCSLRIVASGSRIPGRAEPGIVSAVGGGAADTSTTPRAPAGAKASSTCGVTENIRRSARGTLYDPRGG